MRAGRLNQQISVMALASTQSATSGEMIEKWATTALTDVWAEVSPLKGRELFNARQFQAEVDTLITIRYTTLEIVPTMKITYKTHDYNIQSVINPFESNRELQILCTRMAT
jgi:SPP1 family predicted phage head-tail adaptor